MNRRPRRGTRLASLMTAPPASEEVESEEKHDREGEQQHRNRGGGGRIVALDPPEDVNRCDLGLERDVPRDQDKGAELAQRPCEGKSTAGDDRRRQVGKDDAAE